MWKEGREASLGDVQLRSDVLGKVWKIGALPNTVAEPLAVEPLLVYMDMHVVGAEIPGWGGMGEGCLCPGEAALPVAGREEWEVAPLDGCVAGSMEDAADSGDRPEVETSTHQPRQLALTDVPLVGDQLLHKPGAQTWCSGRRRSPRATAAPQAAAREEAGGEAAHVEA